MLRKRNITLDYSDQSNRVPSTAEQPILSNIRRCINDLKDDAGKVVLPDVKDDNIYLPFYVFTEGLPNEDKISWSDCWKDYNSERGHNSKRSWGYFAAKQLENHRWRVYNPEDALLFVSPYFDFEDVYEAPENCWNIFNRNSPGHNMEIIYDKYSKYVNRHNTLWLIGDFQNFNLYKRYLFHDKDGRNNIDNAVSARFAPLTFEFSRETNFFYHKSNDLPMTIPIVNVCHDDNNKRLCDQVEEHLKKEAELDLEEWLENRPVITSNFGKYDNRNNYFTRKCYRERLVDLVTNEKNKKTYDMLKIDPFLDMSEQPNKLKEISYIPSRSITTKTQKSSPDFDSFIRDWKRILIDTSVIDKLTSGVVSYPDYKMMSEYYNMEDQIRLRLNSRIVVSFRGDTPLSQRSYEGLYFGSLSIHDLSEHLYSFVAPLPHNLPWRLLGLYSEDLVKWFAKQWTNKNYINIILTFLFPGSFKDEHKKTQELFNIMEPLINFTRDDDFLIMLKAIRKYRTDVIWNIDGSVYAENILFEAARMMFKSDRYRDIAQRFNIDYNWFESKFPSSCLLVDGESEYEYIYHMDYTDPERLERLREVILEADHYEYYHLRWFKSIV